MFAEKIKKIIQMKHKSCFGFDSPFGYLIKNKGKNLFIDLDYKDALTFVHVAEEKIGVNYRYIKRFKGNYIDENKKKIYQILRDVCKKNRFGFKDYYR